MDDSKVQSALLGWIIGLAITLSVLLRKDKDRRQYLFTVLCGNVTLYYLFTFLHKWQGFPWFERLSLISAIFIPLGGLYFFRAFSTVARTRVRLIRLAFILAVILIGLVLYPSTLKPALGPAILAYVVGFMLVAILDLNVLARTTATRVDAARIRYLVAGGFIVLTLQLGDRLGEVIDVDLPPLGLAADLLYLYIISQTIVRYRILDLYEMLGRLALMTAMGWVLAIIYTAMAGQGVELNVNAFMASLVILLMFDPLRDFVEQKIADLFFGERLVLEQKVAELRTHLAHVISTEKMVEDLIVGLEESRRITHAALFLIDMGGGGYDCQAFTGPEPSVKRVEIVTVRRFFRPFSKGGAIVTAELETRRLRALATGKEETIDAISEALALLDGLHSDVLILIEGEGDLLGFLSVKDERIKDPFSPEEVSLLLGLAANQVAITVENSQVYQQMKERDRLAALGEMSAGLAHEIRNPLGAIKAAAQYVEEIAQDEGNENAEFLKVIVEEVDRLNRVVSDFLAYAKPSSGAPSALNVNDILKRTIQVFETGNKGAVDLVVDLAEGLPPVVIDGERLHQVFLNLMINATQAMAKQDACRLEITTRIRRFRRFTRGRIGADYSRDVEIRMADNGPGIDPAVLQNVFIPFFTTKMKGSGLGLSICQRLIRDAGGEIELRSQLGQGSIFTVVLPATVSDDDPPDDSARKSTQP